MSYYAIPTEENIIFVATQAEVDANPHLNCRVGSIEDAQNALLLAQNKCLENNASLFHVAKEDTVGTDTTWTTVSNLEEYETDGVFQLFDTTSGLYEKANNKQEAIAKLSELKNKFLAHKNILELDVLDKLPQPPKPDPFEGAGEIPLGVM